MIVLMLDDDGITRVYASGYVKSNNDLDILKENANKELGLYASEKPYNVDVSKFTMQIEVID